MDIQRCTSLVGQKSGTKEAQAKWTSFPVQLSWESALDEIKINQINKQKEKLLPEAWSSMSRLVSKHYEDASGLLDEMTSFDRGYNFHPRHKPAQPFLGRWFPQGLWVMCGLFCSVRFKTWEHASRQGLYIQAHLSSGEVPAFNREPSSPGKPLSWGPLILWAPSCFNDHELVPQEALCPESPNTFVD